MCAVSLNIRVSRPSGGGLLCRRIIFRGVVIPSIRFLVRVEYGWFFRYVGRGFSFLRRGWCISCAAPFVVRLLALGLSTFSRTFRLLFL